MITILLIIGVTMIYVCALILAYTEVSEKTGNSKTVLLIMGIFLGVILIVIGVVKETYQSALTNNPYKKEYLYKINSDGEIEKYDSIYVKKPKA